VLAIPLDPSSYPLRCEQKYRLLAISTPAFRLRLHGPRSFILSRYHNRMSQVGILLVKQQVSLQLFAVETDIGATSCRTLALLVLDPSDVRVLHLLGVKTADFDRDLANRQERGDEAHSLDGRLRFGV